MYCKSCGMQNSENVRFCVGCGSELKAENASEKHTENCASAPQAVQNVSDYQTAGSAPSNLKNSANVGNVTRAVAVLLIMLTVTTMLLGWFNLKVDEPVVYTECKISANALSLSQMFEFAHDDLDGLRKFLADEDIFDGVDGLEYYGTENRWKEVANGFEFGANIAKILYCLILFDVFLLIIAACWIALSAKGGKVIAKIAYIISFLSSSAVLAAVPVLNGLLKSTELRYYESYMLTEIFEVSASPVVYATAILSVIGFVYLIIFKKKMSK